MHLPSTKRQPVNPRHCIHRDCRRKDLVACGNAGRFKAPHHVCTQHVLPVTDENGNSYCSPECWQQHFGETSSV